MDDRISAPLSCLHTVSHSSLEHCPLCLAQQSSIYPCGPLTPSGSTYRLQVFLVWICILTDAAQSSGSPTRPGQQASNTKQLLSYQSQARPGSRHATVLLTPSLCPHPSCRRCYEVKCDPGSVRDNYGGVFDRSHMCYDTSESVVVQVIDSCPCEWGGSVWACCAACAAPHRLRQRVASQFQFVR